MSPTQRDASEADQSAATLLSQRIQAGDRRALARAITLIESTREDHRAQAESLLTDLLPASGKSIRIAVSGIPGVGKSTFIEAFGLHLLDRGHRLAVLAVDPSSPKSGGSILGDKTRMEELSRHPNAFIRPSPSAGTLGGVARRTRDIMLACEAQGFDVIIVETVGVGQSETAVADLVDMFLLLLTPGGGDDLQGIKKGIVELADLIIVNKADGDLAKAADRAVRDYSNALQLVRSPSSAWMTRVMKCSAAEKTGLSDIWDTVCAFRDIARSDGSLDARRGAQARAWMWAEIQQTLMDRLESSTRVAQALTGLEQEVLAGHTLPSRAAREILAAYLTDKNAVDDAKDP